ncbi:MAG: hypothetical protein WBX19_10910 [Terracidiphilus sp.]
MKNRAKLSVTQESGPEATIGSVNAHWAEPAEKEAISTASGDSSSPAEAFNGNAPTDANDQAISENEELSATEAALVVIDQANAIDRIPVNSVIEQIQIEEFSQARLDQLYARWDDGAEAFRMSLDARCEIVYDIHKETAKPGCTGGFSAALRRINLPSTTAYDWITRHKIRIGEMDDPDAYDPRDDEDEGGEEKAETTKSTSKRGGGRRPTGRAKTAVITLSGSIAEAENDIQTFYHKANPKEAIQFCVLRVWSELKTPLAKHTEELTEAVMPEGNKSKRKSLILDDDFLDDAGSVETNVMVTAELPAHIPSVDVSGGLSGAA